MTMAQQLIGFDNAINVYWTLTIEFCLYVLITGFLLAGRGLLEKYLRAITIFLAIVCLSAAAARWGLQKRVPTAIPLGLFCMFIGAQFRLLRGSNRGLAPLVLGYLLVIVPTCIMSYSFNTGFEETPTRYVITYVVGGALFIGFMSFSKIDLGRAARELGNFSYGIYLFHMPLIWGAGADAGSGTPAFPVCLRVLCYPLGTALLCG